MKILVESIVLNSKSTCMFGYLYKVICINGSSVYNHIILNNNGCITADTNANNECVVVTRYNMEKTFGISLDGIAETIQAKLVEVRDGMLEKARKNRDAKTYVCRTMDEIKQSLLQGDGFVKAMWCGEEECEDTVKAETGVGSRCIPLVQENLGDVCVCCGKPAKKMVLWAKAY